MWLCFSRPARGREVQFFAKPLLLLTKLPCYYPVSSRLLGLVEGFIRQLVDGVLIGDFRTQGADHADGDGEVGAGGAVFVFDFQVFDFVFDPLEKRQGVLRCASGEHEAKLLAAQAEDIVPGAVEGIAQGCGHIFQDRIPGGVAVGVVVEFEVIHVHQGEGEVFFIPSGALDFQGEGVVKVAAVVQAGEVIGDGEGFDALFVRDVQSDRRVADDIPLSAFLFVDGVDGGVDPVVAAVFSEVFDLPAPGLSGADGSPHLPKSCGGHIGVADDVVT